MQMLLPLTRLLSRQAVVLAELPGNHILARLSHEATERSMRGSSKDGWAKERAEAVSHDWPQDAECNETCREDCVDEALMESFPASDPPSSTQTHA